MLTKFPTQQIINNVAALKARLPILLANQARNFFVASWDKEGWMDGSLQKWQDRQYPTKKNEGKKILVQSGNLRRDALNSIKQASFPIVRLAMSLPYAAVHNDGYEGPRASHTRGIFTRSLATEGAGLARKKGTFKPKTIVTRTGERSIGEHTMNMPQRKYMGDSKTLRLMQKKLMLKEIDNVFKP